MARLDGKVALVAGGATGIGAATARAMAEAGAQVVLGDINIQGAEAVASAINRAGGTAIARVMDIADEADVKAVIAAAVMTYGGIDVLANVAADFDPDRIGMDSATDLLQLDLAVFDRTMAVNLRGFVLSMRSAVPEMLKRGGGSIINVTSMAGLAPEPIRGAYAVSKGAVNALTQHVATAYGKRGIRCNAIAPGMTTSPTVQPSDDPFLAMMLRHHLTPYLGRYEDQANMIVFLASDDARFVTGTVIRVDGGMLTPQPSYADLVAGGPWLTPQPSVR